MGVYNEKLLIVDSDESIRKVLATRLTTLGYKVLTASNGKDALHIFDKEDLDMVILDIVLPKLDGYEICQKLRRKSQIPIIILSSLNSMSDRILGLELGADDYIIKPFSPKELEVRIRSLLRRTITYTQPRPQKKQYSLSIGNLVIDLQKQQVFRNHFKINLTTIEFSLFELLLKNAGNQLSRSEILDNIWGYTPERDVDTRIVDVHISRLRSKLEEDPSNPDLIITIRGIGYMFQKY